MKKQFLLIGSALIIGFAACNDNSTETTANTDSTVMTNAGDTTVSTTTTTTTTKTVRPIENFERRTFYSVKTKKPVKLRMDTVYHYYVDASTNQYPDYYYYDPATKDTFDYYGRRLNNALIMNNGDYTIDESRISMETDNSSTGNTMGDTKVKAKDDKYKEKTDTSKMKVTNDKMVIKKK